MLAANGGTAAVNLSSERLLTGAVVQMGNPLGWGGGGKYIWEKERERWKDGRREGKSWALRAKACKNLALVTQRFISETHNGRKSKCFASGKPWKFEWNKTKHDRMRERTRIPKKNVIKLNCYHCCVTLSVYNKSEIRPRLTLQLHHYLNHWLLSRLFQFTTLIIHIRPIWNAR